MAETNSEAERRMERNNQYKRDQEDKLERLIERLRRVLKLDADANKYSVLTAAATALEAHAMYDALYHSKQASKQQQIHHHFKPPPTKTQVPEQGKYKPKKGNCSGFVCRSPEGRNNTPRTNLPSSLCVA